MKWALIMYFLYFGPPIGWQKTDKIYYPDYQSCIEALKIYEASNPFPHRVKVRCEQVP